MQAGKEQARASAVAAGRERFEHALDKANWATKMLRQQEQVCLQQHVAWVKMCSLS